MLRAARWMILAYPLVVFAADINPQVYLDHVRYLASPELKGRATGSPELEKAATYIESQFKTIGLQPPDGKSFELPFPVTINAHLGPDNHLLWNSQEETQFQPFSFSSSGHVAGPVVFAGYGITSNQSHYDD